MTAFVAHDPRFVAIVGESPELVRVAAVPAHEGLVWLPELSALLYTSTPEPGPDGPLVRIERLRLDDLDVVDHRVLVDDARAANGMCRAADGGLLVCEQGDRARPAALVHRDAAGGAREVLVADVRGLPLNSPNDVVLAPDGGVWFTDPSYGALQGFRPPALLGDHVHRYDPGTGAVRAVADGFDKPNGIALSQDASVLYVGDSGYDHRPVDVDPHRPHAVSAFDVLDGRRLGPRRLLAVVTPPFPDGLITDPGDRVWVTSGRGVQALAPDGDLLGEVLLSGAVALCLGGSWGTDLFVTTDDAIWAVRLGPGVLTT